MVSKKLVEVNSSVPAESWSLDQLGEFVIQSTKRAVKEIWLIGTALTVVKAKCAHGEWEKWCQKYAPWSESSIRRYRAVAEKISAEEIETIVDQSPRKIYLLLGLVTDPREREEEEAQAVPQIREKVLGGLETMRREIVRETGSELDAALQMIPVLKAELDSLRKRARALEVADRRTRSVR